MKKYKFQQLILVQVVFLFIILLLPPNVGSVTYELSFDEISQMALENNFDIQLAKYDAWVARTNNDLADSIYDTLFNVAVNYQDDQSATTSTILGTKSVQNEYNVGLVQKIPTGTTISLGLDNTRNWNNSAFTTSPLTHDSTLSVTVDQDLGKNFFGIQDRSQVKITKLEVSNLEYTSLERIEESLAQVQRSYWNLVLQEERQNAQADMLQQAKRLYDLQQQKLTDGVTELPEAIAAEANYKNRLNHVKTVENELMQHINVLKLLLNIEEDNVFLNPKDELNLPEKYHSLNDALKNAFNHRRDYQRALNEIKVKKLKLSMKKNNLWPEINLSATLERNGLGDHFKQAIKNITDQDNPNFMASLTLSVPLFNKEARAEFKAAELNKAKELINLKLIERQIAIQVNDKVRNSQVYYEIAQNSHYVAQLQEQKLQEEQKRFDRGRSDTDTLIRFQEDATQARLTAIQDKHRYQISIIDLKIATGVLLDGYWQGEL